MSVHLFGAVVVREVTAVDLVEVLIAIVCVNSAVATINGIVASGSGVTGLSVVKLATEGKGASP